MKSNNSHFLYTAGLQFNNHTGEVHAICVNERVKNAPIKTVRLSPVNKKVLAALITAEGSVLSRGELFAKVWPNQEISDDALTRSISDLRTQLKPLTSIDPLIETIPKVGYRWTAIVSRNKPTSEPSKQKNNLLLPAIFALVLLTLILVYFFKTTANNDSNILILETRAADGFSINDCLKQAVHNHKNLKYLSDHAIESFQGNPYPYFSHEFKVRWFIASEVFVSKQTQQIAISLIDAKTGLVLEEERHNLSQFKKPLSCESFIAKLSAF